MCHRCTGETKKNTLICCQRNCPLSYGQPFFKSHGSSEERCGVGEGGRQLAAGPQSRCWKSVQNWPVSQFPYRMRSLLSTTWPASLEVIPLIFIVGKNPVFPLPFPRQNGLNFKPYLSHSKLGLPGSIFQLKLPAKLQTNVGVFLLRHCPLPRMKWGLKSRSPRKNWQVVPSHLGFRTLSCVRIASLPSFCLGDSRWTPFVGTISNFVLKHPFQVVLLIFSDVYTVSIIFQASCTCHWFAFLAQSSAWLFTRLPIELHGISDCSKMA